MAALARRFASILLTTFMVVGVMAPGAMAAAHESDALALLNAERSANGLTPLAVHSDLTDDAQAWSQHLLAQGSLTHNPNLGSVTTGWDRLSENVGVGVSVESLHTAFMSSSGHRRNILGDYDYVGIAVVEETSSKFWITVVFMKTLDATPVSVEDPEPYANHETAPISEQPIAATPRTAATTPAPAAQVARVVFVQSGGKPIAD
jgi:hypothetical protein